jgi:WD40 repeat protein
LPSNNLLIQQNALPDINTDSIISLDFDYEGKLLASGGKDGLIVIWSLADGNVIQSIPNPSPITALAFSSNHSGTTTQAVLAYGTSEGKLYLWDLTDHRLVAPAFLGINGTVTSLQFSPTQPALVSGSDTGQVLWWDLSPDSFLEKACQVAGRNLTHAEWAQYFPGEPYRITCLAYPEGE